MLKEVFVITFLILLSSTVESQKPTKPIKKVLKIVREIRNQMVTFDEITEIKNQFVDEVKVIKNQIVDEVVGEINPTIASSCSCCEPKPHHCDDGNQGIFIAGGADRDDDFLPSPPGFYNPLTNEYCNLPPMSQPRYGSTTTGFIVCGGWDLDYYDYYDYSTNSYGSNSTYSYGSNNAPYNCEKFDPSTGTWGPYCGSWEQSFPGRALHVAWMSSIGLYLIGGYESMDTSMLISKDCSKTEGAIDSGRWGACAVADPKTDTVIIIGGYNENGVTNEVVRYDIYGNEFILPSLTNPRYMMGCSGYYNNVGNLVLVVTGGYASGVTAAGTEHLEVEVGSSWTSYDYYNPEEISCADANNDVYCLQGYYGYDVEEYDKTSGGFIYKTSTEFDRGYWGNFASSVCIDSGVENWCTYSKSDKKSEPQDHSKPFPEHPEDDKKFPSNN